MTISRLLGFRAFAVCLVCFSVGLAHGALNLQPPHIVWHNKATGANEDWTINNGVYSSTVNLPYNGGGDFSWKIVGVADFNQDGNSDLLWQHPTVLTPAIWFLDENGDMGWNTTIQSTGNSNWRIVGAADFDRDNIPDILFQYKEGTCCGWKTAVWYMSGPNGTVIRLNGGESQGAPLVFAEIPMDQRVPEGASVELSGRVNGYPAPSYRWLRDEVPIPGAKQPTLTFGSVKVSDFGWYTLVASNAFETIQATALLDVGLFTHAGSLDMSFRPCVTEICRLDMLVGVLQSGMIVVERFRPDENQARRVVELLDFDGEFRQTLLPPDIASISSSVMTEQIDGKFILALEYNSGAGSRRRTVRFDSEGNLDPTFMQVDSDLSVRALGSSADGHIYIGTFSGLRRLKPNGELDLGFGIDLDSGSRVFTLAVQDDGRVLLGGVLFGSQGDVQPLLLRFNSDGTEDSSFRPELGLVSRVKSIQIQTDQRIVVGGESDFPDDTYGVNLIRLMAGGTIDAGFERPELQAPSRPGFIDTVSLQSDGRIVVAGHFTSVNGVERNRIARFNPNGSLDLTFDPRGGISQRVMRLGIQQDQYFVLGHGSRLGINGVAWEGLARLHLENIDPPAEFAMPRLINSERRASRLSFSFRTASSWQYGIEASDNLRTPNWTTVSTVNGDGFLQSVEIPFEDKAIGFIRVRAGGD